VVIGVLIGDTTGEVVGECVGGVRVSMLTPKQLLCLMCVNTATERPVRPVIIAVINKASILYRPIN